MTTRSIADTDETWCREYIRKAVADAFTAPPLEPTSEPARALWHVERNGRFLEALGAAGDAYREAFGREPEIGLLDTVHLWARPYFTNPYPGDNILNRASQHGGNQ